MRNDLRIVICMATAFAACGVRAESASESLTRIEAETLVLKAREKQLDVQSSIVAKQNEILAKERMREQFTQNAAVGDPVIRSVEGIGKNVYAVLQMPDGSIVDVTAGDTLSNGMKIVSIKSNEVIVEKGKKGRARLATAYHAPSTFNASFPSPGLSIVPPLPMPAPTGSAK
jgi:type IV pilus biogenesis protein PilP